MNKTRIRFRPPSPPLVSMTNPAMDEASEGGVFLDESDILYEVDFDEEDLPDANDDDDDDDDEEDLPDADDDDDDDDAADERDDSIQTFFGHKDEVYALACSPVDPTIVATGGLDNKVFLWRIGNKVCVIDLRGHNDSVSSLAFSYDGKFIASGCIDGVVQVFDALYGSLRCHFDVGGVEIEWLKWHPKEYVVLAGLVNGSLLMCNARNNANPDILFGHSKSVTCGDFTPDGRRICTGSADGSLRVWNPITRTSIHVIRVHPLHTKGLICLDIHSNSTLVITGSEDGSVHIVSITGRVVTSLNSHTDSVECVKFSPSSSTIPMAATGGMDKKLMIWDLQHSALRFTCDHESGVTCVTWIGASKYLATGCVDGTLSVWDSLLGNCVMTFHGHSDPVLAISVSANAEFIVSVSEDETARVYGTSEFLN